MRLVTRSENIDVPVVERLRQEFDRMLESVRTTGFGLESLTGWGQWMPRLNVAETDCDVVVSIDVPGIDPKEIDLSVSGDVLTIAGQREEEKETKQKSFRRVERSHGSFCRTVTLPTTVDVDKIAATAKDGVLTVTLPKREEARPRQIKVAVK